MFPKGTTSRSIDIFEQSPLPSSTISMFLKVLEICGAISFNRAFSVRVG
jgi:DNA-binding IclR family transcriptional regulator